MSNRPRQIDLYRQSERDTAAMLETAAWLRGLTTPANPNPLTEEEVRKLASSGKPYAWAFQMGLPSPA